MNDYRLIAPAEAAGAFASVLHGSGVSQMEVQEDKCFSSGAFWSLGQVLVEGDAADADHVLSAVLKGGYEWNVPPLDEAKRDLYQILGLVEPPANAKPNLVEQYAKNIDRVRRVMDAVAACAVRVGLSHPTFDARSVEEMPFRRGTTVIADTSGALQGGLDFVANFLHPAARIKVPAIVHMEVVNQADSFLKRRRATKVNTSALLFDHLISQAGQRVLLRLEFRPETEIERTLLVGDPLRNAFQRDTDPEWSDLNLSVPLRSYCDRLIIEAARQHQGQASPGHGIQVLTSDQGFARMALAEGITPLYFRATSADGFFGRRLAGTMFQPLSARLYRVPLPVVMWELATAFGAARLRSADGSRWVEIAAIGEDLAWSPVHSRNDLLWMRSNGLPDASRPAASDRSSDRSRVTVPVPVRLKGKARAPARAAPVPRREARASVGPAVYRFNPERMLQLISALASEGQVAEDAAMRIVGTTNKGAIAEYRRFLLAGAFASIDGKAWVPTDAGFALAQAVSVADLDGLAGELSRVPSVKSFFESLRAGETGKPLQLDLAERAESTYRILGEIICAGAPIAGEGFYPTPWRGTLEAFSELALQRFGDLDTGDGFVSVGAWLEALVRHDGIHPERTRRSLDEASAAGLIDRATEGSTTDTRHDQHAIKVLRNGPTGPRIETVYLYRGDFLIPSKSSSSIRLGRQRP